MFRSPDRDRQTRSHHDQQLHRPDRVVVIAFVLLLALMAAAVLAAGARGQEPRQKATPAELHRFSRRVCHTWEHANKHAEPLTDSFNLYYYNSERTPENLHTAGEIAMRMYKFYSAENDRVRKFRAPVGLKAKWHRYNTYERDVLKTGFAAARALLAADAPGFGKVEKENLAWQRRRNDTWISTGLEC